MGKVNRMIRINKVVNILNKKGYKKLAIAFKKVLSKKYDFTKDTNVLYYLNDALEDYAPNIDSKLALFIDPDTIKKLNNTVNFYTSDEDGNIDNIVRVVYDIDRKDTFKLVWEKFLIKKSKDGVAKAIVKALKNTIIDEEIDPDYLDSEIKRSIKNMVKKIISKFNN